MTPLLEVNKLTKHYPASDWRLEPVSFSIDRGKTLGIVGESGSGKSTLVKMIVGLEQADEGEIVLDGHSLPLASHKRNFREQAKMVQMVFQSPWSALNSRMNAIELVAEAALLSGDSSAEAERKASYWLDRVGLSARFHHRMPHQLSGGQRQRIVIARAISVNPGLLVCDEPTAALDVSVQGEIINLLLDLQEQTGLSMIFITHDLSVARVVSDQLIVLKQGVVEESGMAGDIWQNPRSAYTRTLLSAVPLLTNKGY